MGNSYDFITVRSTNSKLWVCSSKELIPRKNVPKILSKREEELLLKKQIEIELNRKRFNLLRNPTKIHDETMIHLQKETEQKFIERLRQPITYTEIVNLFHYQKPSKIRNE